MSVEVAFTGVCCREPELKTAQSGKAFCTFTLGVGEGDGRQWIRVACFEETAEKVAQQLHKGGRAYCEGFLEISLWEPEGKPPHINLNCRARRCEILGLIGRNRPKQNHQRPDSERQGNGARYGGSSRSADYHRPLDDWEH
jgi:single-stranded DNA-binding protein